MSSGRLIGFVANSLQPASMHRSRSLSIALAVTVLAVNTLGDGLRDTLDPRIARKM